MSVYRRKGTKSQRWFYQFTIDGIAYKRGIPKARTKAQALQAEREARQEIFDGSYQSIRANITFVDFVRNVYMVWAEDNHRAVRRDLTMADTFCEYFKGYSMRQMSVIAVEGFKMKRAKQETQYGTPFMASTINLELNNLSTILSMAVRQKYLRENPCIQVARLKMPEGTCRYLLPNEEAALMSELEHERPFMKPLVRLALLTGLRQCELFALTITSVDFSRNRLYVSNPKWHNDPRRTRGNPIGTEAREILLQLVSEAKGEYLFTSDRTGEQLTRGGMDSAFRRACARAGVPDLKFHSLRHTFGTRLGDANVSLEKIARLMGHSDITMTRRYVHPTDDALQSAVEHASIQNRARIVPESNIEVLGERRMVRQATG